MEELTDPSDRPPVDTRPAQSLRRVDRVVGAYLVAAVLWIVVGSVLAEAAATAIGLSVAAIEMAKGLLFVTVTAVALRLALRRWARRLASAADIERRAAEDLRELSRTRTRFLQSISHELRTPLTSIIGYGVTLQSHLEELEPARIEQLSERLVVNARRLETLVLEVLALDRAIQGDDVVARETIRFDELVKDVLDRLPHDGYVLAVETPALVVELDRTKTERIVDELVRNAVRHTPPGTRIRVAARGESTLLRLTVTDDGPGLESRLEEGVFEPFTQGSRAAESPQPGLGIGLSLVRRYVEMQGGSVTVRSVPGTGTRFDVTLPIGTAPSPAVVGG